MQLGERDAFHTRTSSSIFYKAIAAFYEAAHTGNDDEYYPIFCTSKYIWCWYFVEIYLDVALAYHDHNSY